MKPCTVLTAACQNPNADSSNSKTNRWLRQGRQPIPPNTNNQLHTNPGGRVIAQAPEPSIQPKGLSGHSPVQKKPQRILPGPAQASRLPWPFYASGSTSS